MILHEKIHHFENVDIYRRSSQMLKCVSRVIIIYIQSVREIKREKKKEAVTHKDLKIQILNLI